MWRQARITAVILVASSYYSAVAGVSVTASYEYADISGYRTYNALGFTRGSETTSRSVPRISLHGKPHKFIEIGASYAFIGELRGSGAGTSGTIFPPPGQITVMVPYDVEEDIHDLTFFAGVSLDLHPKVSLSAGPELHYFKSRSVFTETTGSWRTHQRDAEDWRLGGYGMLRGNLGEHWRIQGSYRYVKPPDREVHFFGLGIGYEF